MKQKNNILLYLATLGPIGYLPSPGTLATVVTLPLIWLSAPLSFFMYSLIGVCLIILSLLLSRYACRLFLSNDPQQVIIDEVMGTWITFWALPKTWFVLIMGCVLFRFFDIIKPLGIKRLERFSGGWGVVLDDAAAGMVSMLVLHLLLWIAGSYVS
ncbi:phosphatidylglycerophosphatase A [Candidatus Babeliales bacterium]|nr:phosphatidylglycerophosphatase A [Candidatus Babeliales bacterium]